MKTIKISLFVVSCVWSGLTFAHVKHETSFPDIEQSIYKEAIADLKNQEVVHGYDDGLFRPDNTINRAEFLKIVIGGRYADELQKKQYNERCFDDIRNRHEWYVPYACFAKEWGIITGYQNKYLRPAKDINFAEAAKIIANTYNDRDLPLNISIWYKPYVQYLLNNQLVPPSVTLLNQNITRGEMAEMISRANRREHSKLEAYLHYRLQKYGESETPVWREFQ
jgi:hypothetical protein